nr:putative ribonuclease H-like domain-containing protein [Tanacetum cinerariifolium]
IGLENQLSLKVKVIKSDNGTEFKNSDLNQFCGLKGIQREFNVPKIPQQNGIAERKNKTLIKAARTMLADSLLPIPFWAKAVNTACYTLHVNFLENKPNLAGSGPTWLFDIDSLTRTMNYHQSMQETKLTPVQVFKTNLTQKKQGKKVINNMCFFLCGLLVLQILRTIKKMLAQSRKQDEKTKKEAKGKRPVESVTGYRYLNAEFEDCFDNSSNEVNADELEDITYSDDENAVGAETDFNNLETSITVNPIPTTRIHKDHPV